MWTCRAGIVPVADPLAAIMAYYNATTTVIDVRTPQEFANATMRRAVNIPLELLISSGGSLPAAKDALALGMNWRQATVVFLEGL